MKRFYKVFLFFCLYLIYFSAYSQDSIPLIIQSWRVIKSDTSFIPIDTNYLNLQSNQWSNYKYNSTNLGYLGLPMKSFHVADLNSLPDFYPVESNSIYLLNPANIRFFNTTIPITFLRYTGGKRKSISSNTIDVFHSQNVNKNLNFTLFYNLLSFQNKITSSFNLQNARNNSFGVSGYYHLPYYDLRSIMSYNNLNQSESAGIINDTTKDTDTGSRFRAIYFNIDQGLNLTSLFNNDTSFNSYSLKSKNALYIRHQFDLMIFKRNFKDSERDNSVYPNNVLNRNSSNDSLMLNSIQNKLIFGYNSNRSININPQFFLGSEVANYSMIQSIDTIVTNENDTIKYFKPNTNIQNLWTGSDIKFKWYQENWIKASFEYYLFGYKKDNYQLTTQINYLNHDTFNRINAFVKFELKRENPGWFSNQFLTDYFFWNQNLKTSYTNGASIGFDFYKFGLFLVSGIKNINNLIYFNKHSQIDQSNSVSTLFFFTIKNKNQFRHFHINSSLTAQSTNNINLIHIPALIYTGTIFYYNHIYFFTKGKLSLQTGFDFRYRSKYFPGAYKPSLGVFYLQDQYYSSDLPLIEPFINFKIKDAGFSFKLENVLNLTNGYKYQDALNYPANEWLLRVGITWMFKY